MPGVSRHSLIWAVLVCAPLKAMVFQPIWGHKLHSSLELVMKKRGFFVIIDKTVNKSPSKNMFRATVPAATIINRVSSVWLGHK